MSYVQRVDEWLISRPYQGVVDWSQKKPAWWVEQAAYSLLLCGLAGAVLSEQPAWVRFLAAGAAMLLSFWFYLDSRMPERMERVAQAGKARRFVLLFSVVTLPFAFTKDGPYVALDLWVNLTFLSAYYFAACSAPRPPRRREDSRQTVPQV